VGALSGGNNTDRTPTYDLKSTTLRLFRNVPNPYASLGFAEVELPADGKWTANELAGAKYVAKIGSNGGAITRYKNGTWAGIYISNMPEYGGGTADKQFLYNAITEPIGR
jgi:hypothetical protein